jgi:hypothetical protein
MTKWVWPALAILALWAGIRIVQRGRERAEEEGAPRDRRREDDDGIDRDVLEQAEREVKDLGQDRTGAPEEDGLGEDWGPGSRKGPFA